MSPCLAAAAGRTLPPAAGTASREPGKSVCGLYRPRLRPPANAPGEIVVLIRAVKLRRREGLHVAGIRGLHCGAYGAGTPAIARETGISTRLVDCAILTAPRISYAGRISSVRKGIDQQRSDNVGPHHGALRSRESRGRTRAAIAAPPVRERRMIQTACHAPVHCTNKLKFSPCGHESLVCIFESGCET